MNENKLSNINFPKLYLAHILYHCTIEAVEM